MVTAYFKDGETLDVDFILHHNRRYIMVAEGAYWFVPDRDIAYIETTVVEAKIESPVSSYIKVLKHKSPKRLENGHWLPGKVKEPKYDPDEFMKKNRDLRWMYR